MMARKTITFEYEPGELFDALVKVGDGGGALGSRLVGTMLAEGGFLEAVGLAFYGVEEVSRGDAA